MYDTLRIQAFYRYL